MLKNRYKCGQDTMTMLQIIYKSTINFLLFLLSVSRIEPCNPKVALLERIYYAQRKFRALFQK